MHINWAKVASRKVPFGQIDRYVISEVVRPFLGGMAAFIVLFLTFQMLRLADYLIFHGASAWALVNMVSLLTLSFLPTALPIAFLISVLMAFGRLSADGELVAMKASGFSLKRLIRPVLGFAIPVVILSMALNTEWVPWGERRFKEILLKVGSSKVNSSLQEGTFTAGFFDLLLYADKIDPKTNRLQGVFIYDSRESKNPMTIVAREGEILPVRGEDPSGIVSVLKLYDGNIHRNQPSEKNYQKIDFGEYRLYLKAPGSRGGFAEKPRMLSLKDLKKELQSLESPTAKNPQKLRELKAEYWRRYAIAISPLIFVFFGAGLGTVRTRSVRAGAALMSFVVIVLYYTLFTLGMDLIGRQIIPPWLGMQLANLALVIPAWISFQRASW